MGVTNFSGLNIGSGNDISKILKGTVAVNPASIAAGAELAVAITISGVTAGDSVILNPPAAGLTAGMSIMSVRASATDTVTVRLRNDSGAPIDEASATWTYCIFN
jgi:hypothetical protein